MKESFIATGPGFIEALCNSESFCQTLHVLAYLSFC